MTFSFENFTTENGENGYFMNIHLCFLALNTLGTVLPDPQDEIISWVFNRRGPLVLDFIAMLARLDAAIGFGLSCPEYDELL